MVLTRSQTPKGAALAPFQLRTVRPISGPLPGRSKGFHPWEGSEEGFGISRTCEVVRVPVEVNSSGLRPIEGAALAFALAFPFALGSTFALALAPSLAGPFNPLALM